MAICHILKCLNFNSTNFKKLTASTNNFSHLRNACLHVYAHYVSFSKQNTTTWLIQIKTIKLKQYSSTIKTTVSSCSKSC